MKAFQQKLKQAEDVAVKTIIPGAHSGGPGEEGEELPAWIVVFRKYFEEKKSQVSKSAVQEQVRMQVRTMQNTILPPPEPLGPENSSAELRSEVASSKSNSIPSVNTSVAPGGTLTLVPVSTSTNNNNERNVRRRVSNTPSSTSLSGPAHSIGDLSSLVEMIRQNTKVMLRRSFAEVQRDYESSLLSLDKAKEDNDEARVMFYELAVHNLFKELQGMDA